MNVQDILKVTNGKLICGDETTECGNFVRDSREIKNGDVYIALKGENIDGNNFYMQAIENGAGVVIMSKEPEKKIGNIVLVDDTLKALQEIAKYKRSMYNIPVVAVTGSVGKTSTKDIIAAVLSKKFKVLKTEGNHNNDIGLPLTILRLKDEEAMVIEMGMNHFGEISLLTSIAKPTLAVITNVGTAHIGNLGSRENILKAKMEILEGLQGNSIVINNDNDLLGKWAKENYKKYNVITYGISNTESKYVAKNIKAYEDKSDFEVDDEKVTVPVGGEHFVLNGLCAIAVGKYFNMSMEDIKKGILELDLTKKRMEIRKLKMGAIIINDTYNANYDSMKAAIEYLEKIQNRRKIAVLGDMLELGSYSEELHRKVGDCISNIDILITVGNEAKHIAENAKISNINICNSNEDAITMLKCMIKPEDVILLKASNSMKFGDIVDELSDL